MNYFIINKFQNNKTHQAVLETLKKSEIGKKILDTKLPLSTVKQKETMLMKFNSITDKNPVGILTNELIQKGII
ncbi:MAG: hypothetical protein CXB60_02220 [Spiroplasma poulsonii]|nr:hypothetical protein [Spiroplasma poulsonii]